MVERSAYDVMTCYLFAPVELASASPISNEFDIGELNGTLDADQPQLVAIRKWTVKEPEVQGATSGIEM